MGVVYNGIIVVAICLLMIFLIDFSRAHLCMVAMITPEAKIGSVSPLTFFSFSLLPPEILSYMLDLTGFRLGTHYSSLLPRLSRQYVHVLMHAVCLCGHVVLQIQCI